MKALLLLLASAVIANSANVRIEDVPEGGVQPQVAVDTAGTVHLIYLKGEPKSCDVRYARRAKGARDWSVPITVNSEPLTAVAMGTIRGAQLALGQGGMLHVVWNGTMQHDRGGHGSPLFYTRLEPGQMSFAPQQNLLGHTGALDGGASIAADDKGNVFLVWHGKQPGSAGGESGRVVFVLKSTDNGRTFGTPKVANADFAGTCACCSLKAVAGPTGELFTLYRAAHISTDRDLMLLSSRDGGATFTRALLDPWKTNRCPMSSAALLPTPKGTRGAWETDGKIRSAMLNDASSPVEVATANAKHPVLAVNALEETLTAWTTGTGWNRGGELGWSIIDATGRPTNQRGKASGVPVWSHAAAYAEPDGDFVIVR